MSEKTGGKRGAKPGNGNALKHGLTAARDHRTRSDKRREAMQRRSILKVYGRAGDPLVEGVIRNLVRHETEARWAERYIERRGRVDKNGEPKPVWRLYLEKISPQSDAWRRVLDMLANTAPAPAETRKDFRCFFADGAPLMGGPVADAAVLAAHFSPDSHPISPPVPPPVPSAPPRLASEPAQDAPGNKPAAPRVSAYADPWVAGLPGAFRGGWE